jgi:hypothetical protein
MSTQTNTSANSIATLKLSSARKPRVVSELMQRRAKLLRKLAEQRELALAQSQGRSYAPKRLRTLRNNDTGEKVVREMPVRIKPWWWTGERGEVLLAIHYGSKSLELAKGKSAIELSDASALVSVLELITAAVNQGELDGAIQAASVKLREGFATKVK